MRLLRKDIDKEGVGTVTVIPDELEDMWHAYNLISKGDQLRARTFRYDDFLLHLLLSCASLELDGLLLGP